MVGLADIPVVGKFVERVSEYSVDAVFRGLHYMFCYKAHVDELKSETDKLNIEKAEMSRKVKTEERNGKIIEGFVLDWQNEVEEIQKSAEELSPSGSCIRCLSIPNPVSRFRIGRNAAKKAEAVTKLTDSGKDYLGREIAHLPPVPNMPKPDTAFEEFQSRKDVYNKLWDALVNEDSPLICGIYGMAGVGKTRMMEKFWDDAMEKKIFDKVVRVNVGSEKLNEIKLQDQIADRLDCKLESKDMERRASQLENSLRNGGKILLILDDVWGQIRLDNIIGTSFGDNSSSKGCKILLTSREKGVCLLNNCKHEHLVEITTLSPEEALHLFKNAVGPDTINSLQDESLVRNLCNECGHLPLLIHAVGKALKGKHHNSWMDAHNQLMEGKFEKIDGVDPQVYTGIKLSIDYLPNDEAKYCLFLCSMFPEDANIDVKMLIQLATGSRLIPGGESRVLSTVDSLKSSSLLLDTGEDDEIKVHDIIRDVARSMASTDSECAFLHVKCNSKYFPSDDSDCTGKFLRLDAETDDVHFEEGKVCRDLHTLWLQCNDHPQQFSGDFFRMFVNLSCLMLQKVNISLKQFSLQPLGKLETLTLTNCDLWNTDVSLFPKNLKSLCICYCDLPRPLHVANLKYLRKLEIQIHPGFWKPKLVMVPNVISSLSSLEELHIPDGFIIDSEEVQREPIEMEISKLTHLRSLRFHFHDDGTFKGTNILFNIDRYDIVVDRIESRDSVWVPSWVPSRRIELDGNHWQSWEGLMARAEEVRLFNSDVEVSSICNGHRSAFEDLKRLYIENCQKIGHLASKSHDEIQYSPQRTTCFSQLTILKISFCYELKYLFCNNIAKSLGQLQTLIVHDCYSIEAIIMNEGASDGEIINFPILKSLTMESMWRLTGFYAEKRNMHSGSTSPENMHSGSTSPGDNSAQYRPLFDGKVAFPSLEKLKITWLDTPSVIWGNDCFIDGTVFSFCKLNDLRVGICPKLEILIPTLPKVNNLEYIDVYLCRRLRSMFSPSVVSDLKHLKEMKVRDCGEMREIIEAGEQVITDDGILFPHLTYIELHKLRSLTSFWCYQSGKASTCKVPLRLPQLSSIVLEHLPDLKSFFHGANFEFHMPSLKEVKVNQCGLSILFMFSMFRKLQLENLEVQNCSFLENIVEDLKGDETCNKIITLSQLTEVTLENLPNLKSFFHNANFEFHMPVVKKLKVLDCGLSNALFTRSVFKNLKQLEELSVCDCEMLEGIFEDTRGHETLDTSDKIITLNRVSEVRLEGLPKFKSIFYGATYEFHMPTLRKVKIVGCGLTILFTCSVFREIRQLEELHVSSCESLEHIVEEVGGEETSERNGKSITSSKLSSITLESLPNLKSFSCTSSYDFNMPKLKNFRLIKCPQIEYFSSSKTNTSLVHVTSDWCSEEGFQDLNDYIRQNHKRGTQSERIEEEEPQESETETETDCSV